MPLQSSFFRVFRTAARGLEAQRISLGTASENIANATTSRTADGGPYRTKRAVQELPDGARSSFGRILTKMSTSLRGTDHRHIEGSALGRRIAESEVGPDTSIEEIETVRTEYDPQHPHADADGYVTYPDVNVVEEMTRMISANRIYEANLTSVQAAKEITKRTLDI